VKAMRNKLAYKFRALYEANRTLEEKLLKTTLDKAVQAVFFDEKVSAVGGYAFNAAAVLPNVVGSADARSQGLEFDNNRLMTGLLFNRGLANSSTDDSDLMVFYRLLTDSYEHVQSATETMGIIRARQERTYAALLQAASDFMATFEEVQVWEDRKFTDPNVLNSTTRVPGSIFRETRVAALARSACRFLFLYQHFFKPDSVFPNDYGVLTPGSNSDIGIEFNAGFLFQVSGPNSLPENENDPDRRVGLIGVTGLNLSGALGRAKDIPLEFTITANNLVLRQMYYLKSTTAASADRGVDQGVKYVAVRINVKHNPSVEAAY